jgi:hypothetical protein
MQICGGWSKLDTNALASREYCYNKYEMKICLIDLFGMFFALLPKFKS